LSGSYTGITGVGALAAGSLAAGFSAVSASLGGTGQTSYAVGDILFADTGTSLAKLADVAVGNALISGGVAAAPSYGKIGLATHVDGTLPIANGGTGSTSTTFVDLTTNVSGTLPIANGGSGATTAQGGINAFAGAVTSGQYLRGNGSNVVMSAIQAADVPTLNQNTTGTAGGLSATLAVASGGTGATTLTANNVILGNGASAVNFVAPGTSGNVLTSNGTTWTSGSAPGFPSGTVLLFYQAAAPTGWTQVTTQNNKALRVVSGTGGSTGGSVAFTTAFASQSAGGTVGGTTLSTSEIPSHTHTISFTQSGAFGFQRAQEIYTGDGRTQTSSSTGGGGSHNHSFTGSSINLAVQYIDIILASRN
jgi:hypothetical protein